MRHPVTTGSPRHDTGALVHPGLVPANDGGDKGADLGSTFDGASELYQRSRPDYPMALIDTVIEITGVRAGDQLLRSVVRRARRPCPSHGGAFGSHASSLGRTWRLRPEGTWRRMKT